MDIFKKLHINIPFAEALEQMSGYVIFMKDVLSKKFMIDILQKKFPPKLKDPSSFTILSCKLRRVI